MSIPYDIESRQSSISNEIDNSPIADPEMMLKIISRYQQISRDRYHDPSKTKAKSSDKK